MAIPFLSDIKLNGNQIKELVVDHQSGSDPSVGYHGQLIFRTDQNKIYINTSTTVNSPVWANIAGDITGVTAGTGLTGGGTLGDLTLDVIGGDGITAGANEIEVTVDGSTLELSLSNGSGAVRIKDLGVTTDKLAADAVTGAKIADDAINSEHYAAASIDTAHIANSQITQALMAADAVTSGIIADDAVDSEHYVNGSIDLAHLAADSVDGSKIVDDAIDSEHYVDGSIDTAHIADDAVTGAKLSNDVTIANDLTVTGDLLVSGDTVTTNTATLSVEDPLIILASGNTGNTVDIGFYAKYVATGTKYTGLFRDQSASNMWKLFATTGNSDEVPSTTVNTTSGFTYGNLTLGELTLGTDLTVPNGGTGASTFTDGGVLLGSGTGAITAMAVLADSEMIVGDGTTDPVAESGSTLRTSIGVDAAGTDNSTNVTIAGGSKDYITLSSQALTINQIDLTDDVTGILPEANLPNAGLTAEGVVELADSEETQRGTDTARVVTPDGLASRSVVATILQASVDSTRLRAAITHNLDTEDVIVQCYDMVTEQTVVASVDRLTKAGAASTDIVTIRFGAVPTNNVRVLITSVEGATSVTPDYTAN